MTDARPARVLIAGLPRSGTTWVGRILGATEGTTYVHEPDNWGYRPYAVRAMRSVGGWPVLQPGDEAPGFARLWEAAFSPRPPGRFRAAVGRRRTGLGKALLQSVPQRTVALRLNDGRLGARLGLAGMLGVPAQGDPAPDSIVVKTVHSILALEWIAERTHAEVLIVLRNPLSVLGSQKQRGWIRGPVTPPSPARIERARAMGVAPPSTEATPMEWAAWRTGVFMGALDQALERHSEWTVVRHEQLCIDPAVRYRSLAADLGLRWGRGAEQRVVDFDRPGDDAYDTTRVARDEPERWRERLTEGEVEVIIETLDRFPLRAYGSAVLRAAARSVPE